MTAAADEFVPTVAPGVVSAELDGERLVWLDGRLRRLDAVASIVWGCFDGSSTVGDLARDLAVGFGATEARVEADVDRLCADLVAEGFLVGPTAALPPADDGRAEVRPPRVPGDDADLDRFAFVHQTGRYRALDHDFSLRTTDAALGGFLARRLGAFAAEGQPAERYSIVDHGDGPERFTIHLESRGVAAVPDADQAIRYFLWHVHHEVLRRTRRHVLVHAAGAVADGRAIALPGEMNAGKTTLVAGLVAEGFGYLTDELVAIDLEANRVEPYPRPLKLGRTAWAVLPDLEPPDWEPGGQMPQDLWYVDPRTIRDGAVAPAAPLGFVVAPRFERGVDTRLTPMSRAAGVELLHRHAMNADRLGVAAFDALVRAALGVSCGSLVSGSLRAATATLREFVAENQ